MTIATVGSNKATVENHVFRLNIMNQLSKFLVGSPKKTGNAINILFETVQSRVATNFLRRYWGRAAETGSTIL